MALRSDVDLSLPGFRLLGSRAVGFDCALALQSQTFTKLLEDLFSELNIVTEQDLFKNSPANAEVLREESTLSGAHKGLHFEIAAGL